MKKILCLLLTLAVCMEPLAASERKPRKERRKKSRTERVAAPVAAPVVPAEPVEEPAPEEPERCAVPTDLDLGFTAEQTDSLLAVWRERHACDAYAEFFKRFVEADSLAELDTLPDSIYAARLQALVSPVQLPYNQIVRGYINRYVSPQSGLISRILGLSQYYFPMIEDELLKEGLPVELRALPIIESALQPGATSRAGAVGLWQFMPSTGKGYGLEVNSLVDERRDPIRSTQAACRYLKDLYRMFNDWTLAIAAYNCGPGNVNKAIARSGGKTFWEIYDYLPRETRGYVPSFIGATYAYAYHGLHDIEPTKAPIPLSVDTLHISRLVHFGQIASTIDIPIETLRQLNPQYKADIIPATVKHYTLVLPQRYITQYIGCEAEIMAKDSAYLKEYLNPANLDKKRAEQPASTYYKVKKGDTLGAIARRYRVTTTQLMRWNNIRNPKTLRIGQRIRVK